MLIRATKAFIPSHKAIGLYHSRCFPRRATPDWQLATRTLPQRIINPSSLPYLAQPRVHRRLRCTLTPQQPQTHPPFPALLFVSLQHDPQSRTRFPTAHISNPKLASPSHPRRWTAYSLTATKQGNPPSIGNVKLFLLTLSTRPLPSPFPSSSKSNSQTKLAIT